MILNEMELHFYLIKTKVLLYNLLKTSYLTKKGFQMANAN